MTREESTEMLKALNMMLRSPNGEPISDVCDALGMAIEALSAENSNQETQKSNGDLIYRADAIETIQNAYCKPCKERGDDYHEVRCRACEYDNAIIQIDAVPSAEAEWIPCSERLPSEDGDYLVQMSWWGFQMDVYSWADGWNCHRINGKVSRLSEIDGRDIVAWMPLPEPYKAESEE